MSYSPTTIDVLSLSKEKLEALFSEYKISLTREEAIQIQQDLLKRAPTVTELILWSIQGSEHCSYKSTRTHLKQFITDGPNVILGPTEDAGIVEIARDNSGKKYGIVMSHESHNHPSQIVPYEGAATGIGGNVRDVSCMGAKVIATADPLRFGDIHETKTGWIHDGVVDGIAGYGNPIGVPNIAGDLYYDQSYNDNCLVNVVTLGVVAEDGIIHSRAPENANGYDLILVGKPTDNSGFGGASFASLSLEEEKKEQNKGAVQEPNAFLKRHLLKATYALFDKLKENKHLDKVGFKDLGAGGVACASVELADATGYGAHVQLDDVFTGMDDLHPSVILCSETQERYMWVAHPDITPLILKHYNKTFDLPTIAHGAQAKVVGSITDDEQFIVTYQEATLVDALASDVTRGIQYDRPYAAPHVIHAEPQFLLPDAPALNHIFLDLLAHENIASRAPVYERYDKQVQGITVIESGEADAGVMQPFKDNEWPEEIRRTGIALSVDQNPRYSKISPYWGAVNAVCEAARNVAAVGASPWALTDCLNFGNPEKPEQMWEFVEAVKGVAEAAKGLHLKDYQTSPLPIISGNVSLYNESANGSIAPSPIIACLGKLRDVSKAVKMSFTSENNAIIMVGMRKDECGGSVYYNMHGKLGANVPKPQLGETQCHIFSVTDASYHGLAKSVHDISDGGVAVALAEMCFGNEFGAKVQIPGDLRVDTLLFSETGGFLLEVRRDHIDRVKEIFKNRGCDIAVIGHTMLSKRIQINNIIDVDLLEAKKRWTNGLREKL